MVKRNITKKKRPVGDNKVKKISVIITTYNHSKYIAECINSVLRQRGNFDMEIIIADDRSTDNNLSIIQEYANKDARIRILDTPRNMGMVKNIKRALNAIDGDYFAFCEGDDYWIDDYKLQKQLEMLETHPEYSMCFNTVILQLSDGNFRVDNRLYFDKDSISTDDIICNNDGIYNEIGNFSCCFYRNILKDIDNKIFIPSMADWLFNIEYSRHGKVGYLVEPMSVYRLHEQSQWTSLSPDQKIELLLKNCDKYNSLFGYKNDASFQKLKNKLMPAKVESELMPAKVENKLETKKEVPHKTKIYFLGVPMIKIKMTTHKTKIYILGIPVIRIRY